MTFIYTMQVFLYIVKSLHKMITTIKMWKTFPMPSKKNTAFRPQSRNAVLFFLRGGLYQTKVAK